MLVADRLGKLVDQCWGDDVVPTLVEYIKIPNKSPSFDPQWEEHGYMEDAVKLFERWARERITSLPGATLDISTNSRRWSAGKRGMGRGRRASTATGSMAAAAPTTAMRCSGH
jgi:hypothetical protein